MTERKNQYNTPFDSAVKQLKEVWLTFWLDSKNPEALIKRNVLITQILDGLSDDDRDQILDADPPLLAQIRDEAQKEVRNRKL